MDIIHRGYKLDVIEGEYYFHGTTTKTANFIQYAPCGYCNKSNTPEGHDGCLSHLSSDKSIMNACCGHGVENCAYVQFWNKPRISGKEAISYQKKP